jgi:hypothetical protein
VSAGVRTFHTPIAGIVEWMGVNLFVAGLSAGWIVLPGSAVAYEALLRHRSRTARAFAALSLLLLGLFVVEAAMFGVSEGKVLERYTFYAAPLLVLTFAWALEHVRLGRMFRWTSYSAAALVLLIPLTSIVHLANADQALSLLGLRHLAGAVDPPELVWAPLIGLGVLVVAAAATRSRQVAMTAALVPMAFAAAGASTGLVDLTSRADVPLLAATPGSTLVTFPEGNPYLEMKTLFWNRQITRVAGLGGVGSLDGFPSIDAQFAPRAGGLTSGGRPIPGPFVLDAHSAHLGRDGGPTASFARFRPPGAMVFGWAPHGKYLSVAGRLDVASASRRAKLSMELWSSGGPKVIRLACRRQGEWQVTVGRRRETVSIVVPPRRSDECRFSLVRGAVAGVGDAAFSVRVGQVLLTEDHAHQRPPQVGIASGRARSR